ncbi:hypothetical protein N9U33_01400 [Candidatus Pelagibacter bacterium]|nr:hypothetical protein [Candidatus Pelagibacter bacterium]
MILKNFSKFLSLLIIILFSFPIYSEEKIDIWKEKNLKKDTSLDNSKDDSLANTNKGIISLKKAETNQKIQITDGPIETSEETNVFGVYDPENYNFDLNMWSNTKAEDVRSSIKRLRKIKLSKTSSDILENILLSFSYPPVGMNEKEFADLKINWLIENDRTDLIESFLKQNKDFEGKGRAVQYLVDQNISQANIKKGCEKIKFIDSTIRDSYLEKFKIYCLVFNKKNSQARLLLDLLREQNQSDKFFDDKINFLLKISDKTTNKINEKNLLNFYLSSVTIKDFNYKPSKQTNKEIWKYLNAANLINIEDLTNKKEIKDLEEAANNGQINSDIIFNIYKQIPFNLITLINAKNLYQTLDSSDARSLIYQKYLLAENVETKVEYLFLLEELFKKDKISNVFANVLTENLQKIGIENIPKKYKETVEFRIGKNEKTVLGKVKYNDKILHQSKILKFYLENEEEKKIQKEINKVFKKINKNKKYFFSAKDLALVDTLSRDGFSIPNNFKIEELSAKYDVPKNLLSLIEKNQNAFLALKIVEIIGEDEPYQLDPETIYFITHLLNKMDLIKIRNKVLISALPQRV